MRTTVSLALTSILFAACMSTPTVPAAQAPRPPTGSGWSCFDFHNGDGGKGNACKRDVAACQKAISAKSGEGFSSDGCESQAHAACRYVWVDDSNGEYDCYRTLDACRVWQLRPSSFAKQSECTTYD
jgi:hypothetical protein